MLLCPVLKGKLSVAVAKGIFSRFSEIEFPDSLTVEKVHEKLCIGYLRSSISYTLISF